MFTQVGWYLVHLSKNPVILLVTGWKSRLILPRGLVGGPIMDDRGNMVAMVSCLHPIYYVDQPPSDRQMGIKECIPVSSIVRLMRKFGEMTIYNFKK